MIESGNVSSSGIERPRVDVVVRTLASKDREKKLMRALDSIQTQSGVEARPIVVVNGKRYHGPLFDALQRRPGILLDYLPEASAGHAITAGRRLVTAPCFMFLDDDDELLAHGMGLLAERMAGPCDWDVIVTNGYGFSKGKLRTWVPHLLSHAVHPVRSLMTECWLSPGASIFRSESVSTRFLDVGLDHQEWTYIAFLLAMDGKRIRFFDVPTVTYHDTEGSASKSFVHQEEALHLLKQMKADPRLDRETLAVMERKYRNTLHTLASEYWRQGARRKAWHCHLRSMRPPFTFKYLLFSRKLLTSRRRS